MAGSQNAPQLGLQPSTIRDHAIQLEADIRDLKEYRVNPVGKNRTVNWNTIEPLLESFISYLQKTQDLPTTSELTAAVHATARAQQILSKDVAEIKNILAAPVRKSSIPSYAQVLKDPYVVKPTVQTRPSMGHREILVKPNPTDVERQAQRATAEEIKRKINDTLANHQDPDLKKTQVLAVKRHPSGDLTLFTSDRGSTERIIAHREDWQKILGEKAEVKVPSHGIIIHGVSTQVEAHNRAEIEDKIRWNNPSLEQANVLYSGWLKRNLGEKRASTMVVEFDREDDADHAIENGIVFGAQIFNCEYYDRACKARQCFRCQKYGHIGTHCKAQETCGYCAGPHSTKACLERDKFGSQPVCPNCSKNHPSWSIQCEDRKEELARIEERRMNMPRTHKEAALRRGNFTGKPEQSRETHRGAKENSRTTGEAVILSVPGNQKRGRSPRKITRMDGNQGTGDTTRRVLQELDRNTLPMPGTSKKRALPATTEDRLITSQETIMSTGPFDE